MFLGRKKSYWDVPELDKAGNFKNTIVQYHGHIQEKNNLIKNTTEGWTPDREFRLMARIPVVDFLRFQDRIAPQGQIDEKALIKWLDSQECEHCKVAKGSAKCV